MSLPSLLRNPNTELGRCVLMNLPVPKITSDQVPELPRVSGLFLREDVLF